jgi:hypothetical protein
MDESTIIVAALVLVVTIPVTVILHRNRDWMVSHLLYPPETSLLDTESEQKRLGARAFLAFVRRPVTWISMLCYAVAGALASHWLLEPTVAWVGVLPGSAATRKLVGISLLLIPILCPGLILLLQCRRWMRRFLRDYLNEHGIPICRTCGYDLRGLVSPTCPECGSPSRNAAGSD